MKLSDFFGAAGIMRDAEFSCVDESATQERGALVYCQNLAYLGVANANPNVAAIITTPALASGARAAGCVAAVDPRLAFFRLYAQWHATAGATPMTVGRGEGCTIHPTATISPLARIGDRVSVGARAVIEDCVEIGEDTQIAAGAVLGAEGLLTVVAEDGRPLAIRHAGGLTIGRGVVILSNAVIARSIYRAYTSIGDYTHIGALTYVSHGVRIGAHCVIAANCAITGRAQLAERVTMGASSSVSPGVHIAAGAQIGIGSAVVRDVEPGRAVSGNFAVHHAEHLRNFVEHSRVRRAR